MEGLKARLSSSECQQSPLPKRVLDVGNPEKYGFLGRLRSKQSSIRLVTPEAGTTGRYLTLSHRWSRNQPFVLTCAILESFHEGITFDSLPQTFQDAVSVTRRLGFRYLWIDALCIVQDDQQEWMQEALKMAEVYHNSACTLAAHSAKDDRKGFLAAASKAISLRKYVWRSIRRSRASRVESSRSNFKDEVDQSLLSRRGWVFQERILSRRTLHFTSHHIFSEEKTDDQIIVVSSFSRLPWTNLSLEMEKFRIEDAWSPSTDWYTLLQRYSTCSLTFSQDRLPAISGMARFVEGQNFEGDYIFGLWSKSLHQGLLWVTADRLPQRVKCGPGSIPPSWSWACWKGSIRYPLQIRACKSLSEVLSYSENPGSQSSEKLPSSQQPCLTIRAEVIALQDVKANLIQHPAGLSSFKPPIHGLYAIQSSELGHPFSLLTWVSFDGEIQETLYFPRLSCALISGFEDVDWQYDTELEQYISSSWRVWYFIILIETRKSSDNYRRVGLGAKVGIRPQSERLVTRTIRIE